MRAYFKVHRAREGRTDPRHDAAELRLNGRRSVERDAVARAHAHLHEGVALPVVRVVTKQRLPSEQLRRHPLEPVQVVEPTQEHVPGHAVRPAAHVEESDVGRVRRYHKFGRLEPAIDLLRRDAKRANLHMHVPTLILDAEEAPLLELVLKPEHPLAAGEEVARVLEEEEADQVDVEERSEQLETHGDGTPHVRRREGRMQEEADLGQRHLPHDA